MIKKPILALLVIAALALLCLTAAAATISKSPKKKSAKVTENAKTQKRIASRASSRPVAKTASKKRRRGSQYQWVNGHRLKRNRYYERFVASSFTDADVTSADVTEGEDPAVRAAAIDALGNMNGTVVAIDPTSGRILAMVNQKLALSEGATPCSTIKLAVGLAALSEGIITRTTPVKISPHHYLTLTEALAKSNKIGRA